MTPGLLADPGPVNSLRHALIPCNDNIVMITDNTRTPLFADLTGSGAQDNVLPV